MLNPRSQEKGRPFWTGATGAVLLLNPSADFRLPGCSFPSCETRDLDDEFATTTIQELGLANLAPAGEATSDRMAVQILVVSLSRVLVLHIV